MSMPSGAEPDTTNVTLFAAEGDGFAAADWEATSEAIADWTAATLD